MITIKEIIENNRQDLFNFRLPNSGHPKSIIPFIIADEYNKKVLEVLVQCSDFHAIELIGCSNGSNDVWDEIAIFYK